MKPGPVAPQPPRRRRSDGVVQRDVPACVAPRGTLDARAASLFKHLLAEGAAEKKKGIVADPPAPPVRRTNDWGWRFIVLTVFGACAVTWRWFAD